MNNIKKLALILALVMMMGLLTGCGDKGTTVKDIQKAGELVIATSPDFPPFENLENGEVVGIEIDLLNIICEKMGKELVIEQMNFDSVLPVFRPVSSTLVPPASPSLPSARRTFSSPIPTAWQLRQS